MNGRPDLRVAGTGLWLPPDGEVEERPPLPVDLARVRRMDRFGRAGFFAGGLALAEAGIAPCRPPDPSLGAVFGSAHGCRDSLVDFTLELRTARSVEELSPAVFAETVHNTVNGELAIAWGLGGPSETIVSGRTGGADAIVRAAYLLRSGRAAAVVAGGAEGIHPRTREWWAEERGRGGAGSAAGPPSDAGAALVLAPVSSAPRVGDIFLCATAWFRESDPLEAARRVLAWLRETFSGRGEPTVVIATPDADGAFSGWEARRLGDDSGELYGAAGTVAAVLAVRELRRRGEGGAAVVCRDPAGPVSLLAFLTPRTE